MTNKISLSFLTTNNHSAIVDGVEKQVSKEELKDLIYSGGTSRVGIPLNISHVGAYYYGALTYMGENTIFVSPTDRVFLTSRDVVIFSLARYGKIYKTNFSYMAILSEEAEMAMLLTEDSSIRKRYIAITMDGIQNANPCNVLPFIDFVVENKWHNKPTIL